MRKLLLFCVLLTYFVQTSNAQFTQEALPLRPTNPSYEQTKDYLKTLSTHIRSSNDTDGYQRQLERFENFWDVKINSGDHFKDYTNKLIQFNSAQIVVGLFFF